MSTQAPPRSAKHIAARESLPEDKREMFDRLVDEYKFQAFMANRHPFYSPCILAELVRVGWHTDTTPAGFTP